MRPAGARETAGERWPRNGEGTTLAGLLARPDIRLGSTYSAPALPTVASGFAALDAVLPGGGWPRAALTELLFDGPGCGEVSLLRPALRQLSLSGGWALLVDPPLQLHAPAWTKAGFDLAHLVVVRLAAAQTARRAGSGGSHEALWAAEQALASGAPQAVLVWAASTDARAVRRLQVAAAGSEALAFLCRPWRARHEASAAPLRLGLQVEPQGRLAVHLVKRRGPPLAMPVYLPWWSDEGEEGDAREGLVGAPLADRARAA